MDDEKLEAIKKALRDEAYGLDMAGKRSKEPSRPELLDPNPWHNIPASRWKGALRETPAVKERDNASGDTAFAEEATGLAKLWPGKQQPHWEDLPLGKVDQGVFDLPWKALVRQAFAYPDRDLSDVLVVGSQSIDEAAFVRHMLGISGSNLIYRFNPDVPEVVVSEEEWNTGPRLCLHRLMMRQRDLYHGNPSRLVVSEELHRSLRRKVDPWVLQADGIEVARLNDPVAYCSTSWQCPVFERISCRIDATSIPSVPLRTEEAEVMVEFSIGWRTDAWRSKEYAIWGQMTPVAPMTRLRVEVPKTETTDVVIFTGQTITITLPAGLKDDLVKYLSIDTPEPK